MKISKKMSGAEIIAFLKENRVEIGVIDLYISNKIEYWYHVGYFKFLEICLGTIKYEKKDNFIWLSKRSNVINFERHNVYLEVLGSNTYKVVKPEPITINNFIEYKEDDIITIVQEESNENT